MVGLIWLSLAAAQTAPELYQRSYEQEALGAWPAALATLEQMPSQERASYTWALRRAWLSYLAGDFDRSIAAYDEAIRRSPEAIEPRLGKMLPLLAVRRWVDAERVGVEVLAKDPGSYLARSRTAWARYNLGRYGEAEQLYRGLVADYPSDVEMRAGLGWCLVKLGRKREAAEQFDAVLHVSPRHPSALDGRAAAR